MKTISIDASNPYPVLIGSDLLHNISTHLLSVTSHLSKVAIISDSNVFPLYGKLCQDNLESAGFQVVHFEFPAGEASKNVTTYISIINFLAENQLTRSDAIIALGGGVTGDMAGFTAATYLRGIPYIQIPTSLLAMVDSSVGGKTAIDLSAGKNLVGAFYQPRLVLCDLTVLNTLPKSVFVDGCAEIIKYGVLFDASLFSHLAACGLDFDREMVISRCVELKSEIVKQDEFDTGERQKLNLGHTIGHSIEKLSNFSLTHGQAVAAGMAIIAKSGCPTIYSKLVSVLETFGLPSGTNFSAQELYSAALSDKKRNGDTVNLIIPKSIGDCAIVPTPISQLKSFIEEGL